MKKRVREKTGFYLTFLVTSLFVIAGRTTPAYAEKIAYVDVAKVFDEYEKTKQNDQVLSEQGKKKQGERDAKVQEVRRLKDELALLSDKNKDEKQELIDQKIKSLQEFDAAAREELGRKRDDVVKQILKDIDTVISAYGSKQGYDFIFNERALLYRSDKYDVTSQVLGELNSRFKTQGGKQASKP